MWLKKAQVQVNRLRDDDIDPATLDNGSDTPIKKGFTRYFYANTHNIKNIRESGIKIDSMPGVYAGEKADIILYRNFEYALGTNPMTEIYEIDIPKSIFSEKIKQNIVHSQVEGDFVPKPSQKVNLTCSVLPEWIVYVHDSRKNELLNAFSKATGYLNGEDSLKSVKKQLGME